MFIAGDMSVSLVAAGPSVSSQLLGSGLIGLREGLETAIVVTILVAFLVKSDRRDALKWVWIGVAAAIAMTVGVFLVIHYGENTISGLAAEAIAGVASLVAVAIVTTMVLWMKKAAATTTRNAPVYLKNFARLMRTAPAYMPKAITTATSTPT